ncbi:hypothetical protein WS9_008470 [Paraclostridium sordellii 8483]|uniref:hypothetical protein n=1 Tax=Paraclostridium sordellii TaxID=1505 RepID=UPI000308FDFF|nr:hypothetical protein [Paeniclostridium sordellii]TAN67426.1 hypothetical protein WS9_008470 [Paeniclostridium sordellii 8483]
MSNKVIKTTNYCTILQQTIIDKGSYGYGIERIVVNDGDGQEEIRFMYEKNTVRGRHLVARPLDLPEEDLLDLMLKAIEEKIFSDKFINELKRILTSKYKEEKRDRGAKE